MAGQIGQMQRATVKHIVSGDTIVLTRNIGQTGPEMQFSLASVAAPKLAMKPSAGRGSGKAPAASSAEEPYAFECRERLRNLVIGKGIEFRIDYKTSATGSEKTCGSLFFQGENVGKMLVESGLAKVLRSKGNKQQAPDLDELVAAEKVAKGKALGVWGENGAPCRKVLFTSEGFTVEDLFNEFKGKRLPSTVEWVRDGRNVRVMTLPTASTQQTSYNFHLTFSGVSVDQYPKDTPAQTAGDAAVEAADRVKSFVEMRILSRTVDVRLESIDRYQNLYGSVYHPKGLISMFLLQEGLGELQERGLQFMDKADVGFLRDAQQDAQKAQKGKWHGFEAGASAKRDGTQAKAEEQPLVGRVVEVISGDCVVLEPDEDKANRQRLYLACTQTPKLGRQGKPNEPGAFEAREFLRQLLIGRSVTATILYLRDRQTEGSSTMTYVQLYVDGKNTAAELIRAGLASALRVPRNVTVVAPVGENGESAVLQEAEQAAKKAGLWDAELEVVQYDDLVGHSNAGKAKHKEQQLSSLGRVAAVVEYVFHSGRVKVRLDGVQCYVPLVLAGLTVPRPNEPFADEATAHVRDLVMQRDVCVQVHGTDRSGCLGSLWYGPEREERSLGVLLCELGYATCADLSQVDKALALGLQQAAQRARSARLGLWSLPGADAEVAWDKAFVVSHVNAVDDFYLQDACDPVLDQIAAAVEAEPRKPAKDPQVDAMVLAEFFGTHYRAKVLERLGPKARLRFVDYGNEHVVPVSELAQCPAALAAHTARCRPCGLTGLVVTQDIYAESAKFLQKQALPPTAALPTFRAERTGVGGDWSKVVLTQEGQAQSLNEQLAGCGLARVDEHDRAPVMAKVRACAAEARKEELNTWWLGDRDASLQPVFG